MSVRSPPTANRIFNALARECPDLLAEMRPVAFGPGDALYAPGQRLTHVYSPTAGAASMLVQLASGATAEALTVGAEGVIGLGVWYGTPVSLEHVIQQTPGEAQRIRAAAFCRAIDGSKKAGRLFKHVGAYSLRAAYQIAVCNAHHSVRQRACRWLLTAADRAGRSELVLSQSLLAQMLGVRRQGVSALANALRAEGALDYRRAVITLHDRRVLERATCECYVELQRLYRMLVEPLV